MKLRACAICLGPNPSYFFGTNECPHSMGKWLLALKGTGRFSSLEHTNALKCQMCNCSDTTLDHSQRMVSWSPLLSGRKKRMIKKICITGPRHVYALDTSSTKVPLLERIFSVPQCPLWSSCWKLFHGFSCETLSLSVAAVCSPVLPDCEDVPLEVSQTLQLQCQSPTMKSNSLRRQHASLIVNCTCGWCWSPCSSESPPELEHDEIPLDEVRAPYMLKALPRSERDEILR